MTSARILRRSASELAAAFPPLLADAQQLAATALPGGHGRRRAGMGDEFWQYRPLSHGDEARMIDWRRSARSDTHFIKQREWQTAQTVLMWVDDSLSMGFTSNKAFPEKGARAHKLALAAAILLVRAGERVGLCDGLLAPRAGETQLLRLAEVFSRNAPTDEFATLTFDGYRNNARAVFVSDFLGDIAPVRAALAEASDRGIKGSLLQVLDPTEEAFPFEGRAIFESMGGGLRHETLKAGDLRERYKARLSERKAELDHLAQLAGWRFQTHHTSQPARPALLWLYQTLERQR